MPLTGNEPVDWQMYWRNRDAWTVREFAQLCCGWNPSIYEFPDRDAYNEALDSINRAVRVRVLSTIDELAWPATGAERMYDSVPAFRRKDVVAWATRQYAGRFPFCSSDCTEQPIPTDQARLPARLVELIRLIPEIPAGTSQKQLTAIIKQRLGVRGREAQAYAALIRSDEAVSRDGRALRHRRTP